MSIKWRAPIEDLEESETPLLHHIQSRDRGDSRGDRSDRSDRSSLITHCTTSSETSPNDELNYRFMLVNAANYELRR